MIATRLTRASDWLDVIASQTGRVALVALAVLALVATVILVEGTHGHLLIVAAFVPLAAWAVIRAPTVAVGLLPAVQVLDWIRVQTALASLSPRTVLIGFLALGRVATFVGLLRRRVDLRIASAALAIWWLLSPLRSSHSVYGESPLRGLVTDGSFVAIVMIGATFGNDFSALRNIARGAAAGLLVLGAASVLVSLGWLPEPDRVSPGREIFGVQSPFSHNYGFDVPWDAVALLVPLCAPFYWLAALDPHSSRRTRYEATAALALLSITVLLLFQARAMVAQIAIAAVAMSFLAGRRVLAVVGTALVLFGVAAVGRLVLDVDEISTSIRVETDLEAVSAAFGSIRAALMGVDEQSVVGAVLSEPALGEAAAGFSAVPIHNLFLSNLVTGGLLSVLALASVVVLAGVRLLRSDLSQPAAKVLLVAFALVLLELNLEPVRSNVIGSWLVLGLVLGQEIVRKQSLSIHDVPGTSERRKAHSAA